MQKRLTDQTRKYPPGIEKLTRGNLPMSSPGLWKFTIMFLAVFTMAMVIE